MKKLHYFSIILVATLFCILSCKVKSKIGSKAPMAMAAEDSIRAALGIPEKAKRGYYASRPGLKTMHNEAARALLSAETFQVISNKLVPSSQKQTHINALLTNATFPSTPLKTQNILFHIETLKSFYSPHRSSIYQGFCAGRECSPENRAGTSYQ